MNLWEKINQRYLLFYDKDLDEDMQDVVLSILEEQGVFTDVVMTSQREVIQSDGTSMTMADKKQVCNMSFQERFLIMNFYLEL